jgi:hypothetical protein
MLKSKFEEQIAPLLGIEKYEVDKFPYVLTCHYTPDWKITDKLYVESKGLFSQEDRRKMKVVKETYPHVTFILCFQNANKKIAKNSKTTYAKWATKNGFIWCELPDLIKTITKMITA